MRRKKTHFKPTKLPHDDGFNRHLNEFSRKPIVLIPKKQE